MNVEAIQAMGLPDEVAPPVARSATPAGTGASFVEHVSAGLQQVNRQLLATQSDLQGLAVGEAASLHEVMIRLEESRIALQLMLQVRNRVLEAYQDVMRMQV